jgi:hypothetical protein
MDFDTKEKLELDDLTSFNQVTSRNELNTESDKLPDAGRCLGHQPAHARTILPETHIQIVKILQNSIDS